MWLCLFDGGGELRVAMERIGEVFVAQVDGVTEGQRYGYRAQGSWNPEAGMYFDSAKLLADPYATRFDRPFRYDQRLSQRGVDTAALVPKAVFEGACAALRPRPAIFQNGGLIYELNVRGFSMCHPDVPVPERGTLAALRHPSVVAHFQKLHVSAIELMPITAWIDERHLAHLGLANAWGYNPVVPMAVDPRLAPGGIDDLRQTAAVLRDAGIGVILDLVFNHSGESDLGGPILSYRGLDNRTYYAHGSSGVLINDAGTGNTLNFAEPVVRDLTRATLRHFVEQGGVDGFRFDLATILARGPGFDPRAPFFAEIANDPVLADRIMIAEPWDIGPDGYQLGQFPGNWLEWNDRYRDDVRRFWRGDGALGALATRMTGSSDIFARPATRTVNFIATHDGFTLADLVSYEHRHNETNGEQNRDGHHDNLSWNNGVEGPSDDADVLARRLRDLRALLATLFASRGTIQLTAGDEFGRSQLGNNNAYAQDNALSWIDWAGRDTALEAFVAELAAFRAAHPELADPTLLDAADWCDINGAPITSQMWEDATQPGFQLALPVAGGQIRIRVDRRARICATSYVAQHAELLCASADTR